MIITKLINNLKCLTQFYNELVAATDEIEAVINNPFIKESLLIEASALNSDFVNFIIPNGAQIASILLYRVGESGFDDVDTIEISNTTISLISSGISILVQLTGTHATHDYEVEVTYYYP